MPNPKKKLNVAPKVKSQRITKQSSTKNVPKSVSTALGGVLSQTLASLQFLKRNKGVYSRLLFSTWLLLVLVAGISQQVQYQSSKDLAELYSADAGSGATQKVLEIGVLIISTVSGGQNVGLSETQQLVVGLVYLFLWLSVVWLIRHTLAGSIVTLRDVLYNAGGPIISTSAIWLIGLLQLLPFALGLILYSAASVALQGSVYGIIAAIVLLFIGATTLYWFVTTAFAAIIVTIPGTYPIAALRTANQLVRGLRTSLVLRMLWLAVVCLVFYIFCVSIAVTVDRLLGSPNTLIITGIIQLVMIAISIYAITYWYLLYRKVVDARS